MPRDVVRHVAVGGEHQISLFTSGTVPSNPSELLSGRRVQQLLTEMGGHYDYVIVDSAPILPVSDSVALASAVDGVLVVTHAGRVTDENLLDTLERLERVAAPVLGLVLNQVSEHLEGLLRLRRIRTEGARHTTVGHDGVDRRRRMTEQSRFVRRNRVDERIAVAIAAVAGIVAALRRRRADGQQRRRRRAGGRVGRRRRVGVGVGPVVGPDGRRRSRCRHRARSDRRRDRGARFRRWALHRSPTTRPERSLVRSSLPSR